MKRYWNYILILANVLIFISVVLQIGLLIYWKRDLLTDNISTSGGRFSPLDVISNLKYSIIAPILAMVLSCCLLLFYQWKVHRVIKTEQDEISQKSLKAIKYAAYVSLANYIITCLFGIIGGIVGESNWNTHLYIFIVAAIFSGLFGLTIVGIISYLNLRMSFDKARKDGSLAKLEEQELRNDTNNNESIENNNTDLATSGSF